MKLKLGQEITTKEGTYTYHGTSLYAGYHGLHVLRNEKFELRYCNDEQLKKLVEESDNA